MIISINDVWAIWHQGLPTAAISFGASYYVGLALLVITLLVVLVYAYRVWEEIHEVEEPASASDLLESFEQAHAAGMLDDQEFARVRRQLAGGPAVEGDRAPAPAADAGGREGP